MRRDCHKAPVQTCHKHFALHAHVRKNVVANFKQDTRTRLAVPNSLDQEHQDDHRNSTGQDGERWPYCARHIKHRDLKNLKIFF